MSDLSVPTDSTSPSEKRRQGLYGYLATSDAPIPRAVRWTYRRVRELSVPAPAVIVKPLVWIFVHLRMAYHEFLRIFICEPFFKAHCTRYGRNLHTGCFLHWIDGGGDIILGDNVRFDGKGSVNFGARFTDRPVLEIGDNSGAAHGCRFVVGRRITIGRNTVISGDTIILDSNGHHSDTTSRLLREPPKSEDVRPVVIGDGVWIGMRCLIFPGVKIGDGSVVSAGSVVRSHVPPYSVVAGNPARVVFRLRKPTEVDVASVTPPTKKANQEQHP
jgi:acetyltransferase-like isoleucine patch superfamily enzyme